MRSKRNGVTSRAAGSSIRASMGRRPSRPPESFEPFDGSMPMLPPWRPASPEEDFSYHSAHTRACERAAEDLRPIVAVAATSDEQEVLYAELVQGGLKGGRAWLRPLMLVKRGAGGSEGDSHGDSWLDMRATSDVFLPEHLVVTPDDTARTLVVMSVAASERDLLDRCIGSDDGFEDSRFILSDFVRKLDLRLGA
jgi:hypothetical protein